MPYSKLDPNQLILRDYLARDRTVLANERTLLAYVRTAIVFLAAGATLPKVFPDNVLLEVLGIALLFLGVVVMVVGLWRFTYVARRMRRLHLAELEDPDKTDENAKQVAPSD